MDFKRKMEVERDRERIISFLKSEGITVLDNGQKVEELSLMSLSILKSQVSK